MLLLQSCRKEEINNQQKNFALTETLSREKEIFEVSNRPVRAELDLTGKITLNEDKVAKVFPLAGGFVRDLYVELGDFVEKGQVMAIIRSPEIAGFTKEGVTAEAEKKQAEKKLKVAEELYKTGIISQMDYMEAQKEYESAAGESARIQDVLDMYGVGSGAVYPIKSPVSGVVVEKNIALNMELRTEDITPAFVVGSIEDVWVMANIYESDIQKVKLGYDAEVTTISYPDRVFKGEIDKIFSLMDAESKVVKARVTLKNENFDLKPEMFARVVVKYDEPSSRIAIPSQALIFDKSKHFVMIYHSDDNIETREVTVYKEYQDTVYIDSGLSVGDKVMTKHQLLVYDALND